MPLYNPPSSVNLASPGPIGGTTPGNGTFAVLSANTSLQVGGGTVLTQVLFGSGSVGSASIPAGTSVEVLVSVTTAASGNVCAVSVAGNLEGSIVITNWYATADNVVIKFYNTDLLSAHSLADQMAFVLVFKAT